MAAGEGLPVVVTMTDLILSHAVAVGGGFFFGCVFTLWMTGRM
jgi:hypothetical protein